MIRTQAHLGFISALLALLMLLGGMTAANAHEIRPSIASLAFQNDGTYSLSIDTNVEALIARIGGEHDDTDNAPTAEQYNRLRGLAPAELEAEFKKFAVDWLKSGILKFGDQVADLTVEDITIPEIGDVEAPRDTIVVLRGALTGGARQFVWSWPQESGASVLRVERPGQELQAQFFDAGEVSEAFDIGVAAPRSFMAKSWDYLVIGYTHILPKGLDHILFVLGLFLLATTWRPLIWQVTAFTLAHSVTLGLGLYGVVNISPSIVEPLIALSIVYVAVENVLTNKLHAWRPLIVFGFGLLHGLGFAGILTEIGMPRSDFVLGLVSFNVGVELGQLTVILLAWLAVGWAMKKDWYRQRIVIPASLLIAAIGAYWFLERTILS